MPLRTRTLRFVVLALLIVVASSCTTVTSSGKEEATPTPIPPPPVAAKPTYVVQRGEVVDMVSFPGRVSPVRQEELSFRASGRVEAVYVERNALVEEGQLLAELINDDLERQLAQAQIELETAETNLQKAKEALESRVADMEAQLAIKRLQLERLKASLSTLDLDVALAKLQLEKAQAGPTPEEIEAARQRVEKAKNALWRAQASRDAVCGVPSLACDQAQASVNQAEIDVRLEEMNLQKLLEGPSEETLLTLRANYEKALQRRRDAEIEIAIKEQEIALAEKEIERSKADVDPQLVSAVERAKLSVERIQDQLDATRIVSPMNGRVLSISIAEGREVTAYTTAMVVADESEIEITAEPTTEQLEKLAEGMKVEITLSQYPGKVLKGEIYQLPYPYGRGGGGTSTETREVDKRTRISFDPEDLALKPGDLVRVDVTVARKEDALWLPPAAIRTFAGRSFVVVEENGVQRRVDIVVGIEGTDRVEIEEGLEEGQVVVGQ